LNRIKQSIITSCMTVVCAWPMFAFAYALPPSASPDLANQYSFDSFNWFQPPLTGMIEPKVTNSTDPIYHIKSGDTLSLIAQEFSIDVTKLVTANDLQDPNLIHTGEPLLIPTKTDNAPQIPGTEVVVCTLTAYTSGPESTGKTLGEAGYGITSTGVKATQGETIAVDPTQIPYGSHVYIEGVGYRTAEDTGGAIQGDRIDVYYTDLQTALDFGVKSNVKVYILPPAPSDFAPLLTSWQ